MIKRQIIVAVVSLLLPLSLYAKNDSPEVDAGLMLAGDDNGEEGECVCKSMEIDYALNIKNKAGNIIAEGDRNQKAEFDEGKTEVELKKITASETNVEKGKELNLSVTPKLICSCSVADSICEEQPGTVKLEIKHKKEELQKEFSLSAVPFEIDVKVSKSCKAENCEQETCSVTIPIKIEKKKNKK